MNIPALIKAKRLSLSESQSKFGKRFGVTHAAVSDWEADKSEAPYRVISFILIDLLDNKCPHCKGTGIIKD